MDIKHSFGIFFIALGIILFLVNLHIMTIKEAGDVASVLNTTFIIFLRVTITLTIFAIAFLIIHLLKWMVWNLTTPTWKKKQRDKQ